MHRNHSLTDWRRPFDDCENGQGARICKFLFDFEGKSSVFEAVECGQADRQADILPLGNAMISHPP